MQIRLPIKRTCIFLYSLSLYTVALHAAPVLSHVEHPITELPYTPNQSLSNVNSTPSSTFPLYAIVLLIMFIVIFLLFSVAILAVFHIFKKYGNASRFGTSGVALKPERITGIDAEPPMYNARESCNCNTQKREPPLSFGSKITAKYSAHRKSETMRAPIAIMSRVKSLMLSLRPIHRWSFATLATATRRNKNRIFLSPLSANNGMDSKSDVSCDPGGTLSYYSTTSHSIISSSSTSHSPALPLSPTSGYYSLCEVPLSSDVVLDSFNKRSPSPPYTSEGITEGGETKTMAGETTAPRYLHGFPLETIQEESIQDLEYLPSTPKWSADLLPKHFALGPFPFMPFIDDVSDIPSYTPMYPENESLTSLHGQFSCEGRSAADMAPNLPDNIPTPTLMDYIKQVKYGSIPEIKESENQTSPYPSRPGSVNDLSVAQTGFASIGLMSQNAVQDRNAFSSASKDLLRPGSKLPNAHKSCIPSVHVRIPSASLVIPSSYEAGKEKEICLARQESAFQLNCNMSSFLPIQTRHALKPERVILSPLKSVSPRLNMQEFRSEFALISPYEPEKSKKTQCVTRENSFSELSRLPTEKAVLPFSGSNDSTSVTYLSLSQCSSPSQAYVTPPLSGDGCSRHLSSLDRSFSSFSFQGQLSRADSGSSSHPVQSQSRLTRIDFRNNLTQRSEEWLPLSDEHAAYPQALDSHIGPIHSRFGSNVI